MPERFSGVFPVLPTPFDEEGRIDFQSVESLIEFEVRAGVDGLVILGILGEAHKLADAERIEFARQVIRFTTRRIPVIVGVSHAGTVPTAAFARTAAEAGAGGIMVAAPPGLKDPEALVAHFRTVADGAGIPLVVQDEPVTTGVELPVSLLARLVNEIECAQAIKLEEGPTLPKLTRTREAVKGRAELFGGLGGLYFLEELGRGAAGVMTGFAYPEILVAIYKHFRRGNSARAAQLFYRYLPLIRYEAQTGIGLAIRKELLRRRGAIRSPAVRAPGPRLDQATQGELDGLLDALALTQGFVEPSA